MNEGMRAYPVHTPFRPKKRQNGPRIGERERSLLPLRIVTEY